MIEFEEKYGVGAFCLFELNMPIVWGKANHSAGYLPQIDHMGINRYNSR
jgi:hypothetical protein